MKGCDTTASLFSFMYGTIKIQQSTLFQTF